MTVSLKELGRAETAALIVETLAARGIDVVLVGGSCVCIWTDDRFGSFDLDAVDISYKRRKQIAAALSEIGFQPQGALVHATKQRRVSKAVYLCFAEANSNAP
ncbi:MAG: hypothetical protein AAF756_20625 [Pseudomonadota bacterium]